MTLEYDTWQANKDRPVWVRGHREDLDALTSDDAERVPQSVAAVHAWVDQYDSVVSRALKANAEEGDDDADG